MHRWPLLLQGFVLYGCDTWYCCSHLVNMRKTFLRTGYHNKDGRVGKWKGPGFETMGLNCLMGQLWSSHTPWPLNHCGVVVMCT